MVQFLESHIAQLEIEIENSASDAGREVSSRSLAHLSQAADMFEQMATQQAHDELEEAIVRSPEVGAMIGATIPTDPALTDLVSRVRMGLTPSFVLPVITGQSPESRRVTVSTNSEEEYVDCSTLTTLPDHVIHTLVRKYIRYILPQAPIMLEGEINRHLETVLAQLRSTAPGRSPERVPPSFSFLTMYIILAISSTLGCAQSQHESRCIAFSEILFREGTAHLATSQPFPDDLAGIQANLMILQYAEINPKCANVWILSGAAMRSCLELGLHREPVRALVHDASAMDLRRRIFWMGYCMDRTISPALQRPLSIPDSYINTLVPGANTTIPQSVDAESHPPKSSVLRWIEYCRIQSEMTEVHVQGKVLDRTWNEWLVEKEASLNRWYREDQQPDDGTKFAYAHGLVRLHRPSPRIPMPSPESLLSAFEAACKSAKHYREPISSGFVRRLWLAAHHTAETAMVAIFCLRHAFDEITATYSISEIFDMTKTFTGNLITLAGQGWAETSNFAATFEKLLAPLLGAVLTKATAKLTSYPPELDTELNSFLLPRTAQQDGYFVGGLSMHVFDPGVDIDMDDIDGNDWFLEAFGNTAEQYSWESLGLDPKDLLVSSPLQ